MKNLACVLTVALWEIIVVSSSPLVVVGELKLCRDSIAFVVKSATRHVGFVFLCMSACYPDGMLQTQKCVTYLGTPPMF